MNIVAVLSHMYEYETLKLVQVIFKEKREEREK
jgi:hypothetical protein